MAIRWKTTDSHDAIRYTALDAHKQPVNLIGATARFLMGKRGDADSVIINEPAQVVDEMAGKLAYELTEIATLEAGTFNAEFHVEWPDGSRKVFPSEGYLAVTVAPSLDVNKVGEVEERIILRVSQIEEFKDEIVAEVDGFKATVGQAEDAAVEAEAQADYAKVQGDYAKIEADRVAGMDVSKLTAQLADTEQQVLIDSLSSAKTKVFKVGDKIKSWGFFNAADGGESEYIVTDTEGAVDGISLIDLDGELKAKLIRSSQQNSFYFPYMLEAINSNQTPHRKLNGKDVWGIKSADVYTLYDELKEKYPNYITKHSWGIDSSGSHPLDYYVLDPGNTKRTIILSSGTHGDERTGVVALYDICCLICSVGLLEPTLQELRQDTKIVIIPQVNPWGMSQSPVTRGNVNLVDINRNFAYKWSTYDDSNTYGGLNKGTSPFSEKESQFVREVVTKFSHENIVLHADFHNGSQPANYVLVTSSHRKNDKNIPIIDSVLKHLKNKYPNRTQKIERMGYPIGTNWTNATFEIPSHTIEWWDTGINGTGTRVEVQSFVEWALGIILEHTRSKQIEMSERHIALTHDATRDNGGVYSNVTVNTYQDIPSMSVNFKPPSDGVIKIQGKLQLLNTSDTALNYVTPRILQSGNIYSLESISGINVDSRESYYEGNKRSNLSIFYHQPVEKFNESNNNYANIKLQWKTSAGTLSLYRALILIEFIPNVGQTVYYRAKSTGLEQVFPLSE